MKNSVINNLGYTGIVTLSLYNDSKKIPVAQVHNSGYSSLFNFLANCLMGDFDTANFELPTKIKLLYSEIDPATNQRIVESASGFIYFLNRPERLALANSQNSSAVCYSFVVPRDIIENAKFNSIGLYPNMASELDIDSYSAICDLGNNLNGLASSAVLVVDWKLIITNNG